MSMCRVFSCCWKRVFAMTSAFSWQNSVSLCPASFCTPKPNLPVTPGISWLPTFAFLSPLMKRTYFGGVSSRKSYRSSSVQFSSVTQPCLTLCDPMSHTTPGLPVHHQFPELLKLMSIESVMPSNHLILCHPLPLLPSIFPSNRVFSNESVLRIRWPEYSSFSFSISRSREYSGLISIRTDWFDLLAVHLLTVLDQ